MPGMSVPAASPPGIDPIAVISSKQYIAALVLAAVLGVTISVLAYGFLAFVAAVQQFDEQSAVESTKAVPDGSGMACDLRCCWWAILGSNQ